MKRREIMAKIKEIVQKHGIKKAYLFGSFARKERNYHDIDVAIEPPNGFSLMDMAGVLLELEDELGEKVDLVSLRPLKQRLMQYIKKDLTAVA